MIESKIENSEVIVNKETNTLNAKNIAFLAFEKQNEAIDSNNLKPIYLRKSSAEIQKQKKQE